MPLVAFAIHRVTRCVRQPAVSYGTASPPMLPAPSPSFLYKGLGTRVIFIDGAADIVIMLTLMVDENERQKDDACTDPIRYA